jgi:hypothetical protein
MRMIDKRFSRARSDARNYPVVRQRRSRRHDVAAAWEGDLNRAKAHHVLDGDEVVDVTAG